MMFCIFRGAGASGTLKDPGRVRENWQATFDGSSNAQKVAVLEEGMKYTPISISPEQAMSRALLTPEEKKKYFFKFNVDGLMRGDYQSRMQGYATARQNGCWRMISGSLRIWIRSRRRMAVTCIW
jgi:hypothetical protein